MNRLLSITLALGFASCMSPTSGPEPKSRPNIIVMLTDDQGWQDTSEPFAAERTPQNDRYRTPNIERLVDEGMKFTNSYSNAVCTSTRVELMTGLNQVRTRVSNWTHFRDEPTDRPHPDLVIPKWNTNGLQPVRGIPLSVHARTLPQLLQSEGYRTIHIGKGHLGTKGTPGEDPKAFGFDVRIGGRFSGAPGSYYGTDNFAREGDPSATPWRAWDMEEYFGQEIYLTEALTLEAIAAVRQAVSDGKPFFLYFAQFAPHTPIQPDPRFVQRYLDAGLPESEAAYASMIEGVDKSLGDIMDLLEELNIDQSTAVFFTSDNGGRSLPGRQFGVPHTHNAPLNSGKGSTYEGKGSASRWQSSGPVSLHPAASRRRRSQSRTSSLPSWILPGSSSAAKAARWTITKEWSSLVRNWTAAALSRSCEAKPANPTGRCSGTSRTSGVA